MRDELEQMIVKHGLPWVVALAAVAVSKLYSKNRQTLVTVIRSLIASLLITFLIVENQADASRSTTYAMVALAAMLSDYIVEAIMALGQRIKDDPSVIKKWFGGDK